MAAWREPRSTAVSGSGGWGSSATDSDQSARGQSRRQTAEQPAGRDDQTEAPDAPWHPTLRGTKHCASRRSPVCVRSRQGARLSPIHQFSTFHYHIHASQPPERRLLAPPRRLFGYLLDGDGHLLGRAVLRGALPRGARRTAAAGLVEVDARLLGHRRQPLLAQRLDGLGADLQPDEALALGVPAPAQTGGRGGAEVSKSSALVALSARHHAAGTQALRALQSTRGTLPRAPSAAHAPNTAPVRPARRRAPPHAASATRCAAAPRSPTARTKSSSTAGWAAAASCCAGARTRCCSHCWPSCPSAGTGACLRGRSGGHAGSERHDVSATEQGGARPHTRAHPTAARALRMRRRLSCWRPRPWRPPRYAAQREAALFGRDRRTLCDEPGGARRGGGLRRRGARQRPRRQRGASTQPRGSNTQHRGARAATGARRRQ